MSAVYRIGDRVRVRAAFPPGHCRTPSYCRGRLGTVVRYCGEYRNPEQLAYGADEAAKCSLYRVRFARSALWPDDATDSEHQVEIELYEHWLVRPGESAGAR